MLLAEPGAVLGQGESIPPGQAAELREALAATRAAETALNNENFGAARTHLIRARSRLEAFAEK